MKNIQCYCGGTIQVDDEDFDKVIALCPTWTCSNYYKVQTTKVFDFPGVGKRTIPLAEFVLGKNETGLLIDHKDLNIHNNQKTNLRHATKQQNAFNRGPRKGSQSGLKGVAIDMNCTLPYRAYIQKPDKSKLTIGRYATAQEAAIAYNTKAKELFGEFAYLNPE